MAVSSPLPRWAPTPSPSRPLWRWGGGTPDAQTGSGGGSAGWSLGRIFPWASAWQRRAPAGVDGRGPAGFDGVEAAPSTRAAVAPAPARWAGTDEDPGVFLTWEDVCVTVAGGTYGAQPVSILSGITGHAGPGEVLAIMGPSGCGKTTLLDTLAGRLGPGITETGSILINGRREKLAFGTSAYVTQDNVLMSTMSVREAIYYSAQLQLPGSMSAEEKRAHADAVIREMGLGDAMDTRIGGRMTKGISGGQRKRVTICVEMLTRPRLLFLDEPTSGLDSAASYHVMSHIARVAAREGMTVVAAVHQPCGDVFDLFHRLCLLAYGRTVFFGPASDATQFFTESGFPCPHLRNPSDHFLRTINKDFDEEIVESSKARRKPAAEAIEILTDAYQSPAYSEKTMDRIAEMKGIGGAPFRKREQASFSTKLFVLTRRSFVNMHRDIGYYWMRLGVYLGIGICLGTIFYQVGHSYSSIQSRCEVIMYTTALITFMAIGGFPSFVEDVKVFRRERLSGHYGVAEFVISNTLSATPYLAVIAVIPGAMLYYLTGLMKDFLMGIIVGAGVQGVMMLNGGFFRLPNELPKPVWKYPCYYISFHKYAVQGFYKNEFIGQTFPSDQLVEKNVTISGLWVLQEKLQVEMGYSKWVNIAILCGMMVVYRVLFFAIVKIAEEVRPKLRGMRCKLCK
ncbi:ABC transporter G family member 11-like isoform X2 [Triticum dicoccoides]|uniref:ABC transporter G family member 11-like isoform X2 n=1 Tax=Triticum dicoccoides TaxID=85692 RepID=UPI0018919FDC|nr:ABC transporter G family member 11-like isoform X2 [Triticum dicoccoides]XP_044411805.1 ABC transporter G family member 1-like isoform X2 [Triticum aestivum]